MLTPNRHPEQPGHARLGPPRPLSVPVISALSGTNRENSRKAWTVLVRPAALRDAPVCPPVSCPVAGHTSALQESSDVCTVVTAVTERAASPGA
jgi:hypothetical protein